LFNFAEIWQARALWIHGTSLVIKAENEWRDRRAAASGNAALIVTFSSY